MTYRLMRGTRTLGCPSRCATEKIQDPLRMFSVHCRERAIGTRDSEHNAFVVRAATSELLEIRWSKRIHRIGDNLDGPNHVVGSAGACKKNKSGGKKGHEKASHLSASSYNYRVADM
jgi:hypothetical protein